MMNLMLQKENRSVNGNLPNLIVIGAQKGGTTSLHYYLRQHPQIFMSSLKELDFFVEEVNWSKGIEWYRRQFRSERQVLGESSPTYTHFPRFQGVPERIHRTAPQAKLIYMLRDPVERVISNYTHKVSLGIEERPFEEAVLNGDDSNTYVNFSRYFLQLKQYLPFFDENQMLILTSEELDSSRPTTMAKVFDFLDVDRSFNCSKFDLRLNESFTKRVKTPFGKKLASTPLMVRIHNLPRKLRRRLEGPIYYPFSKPVAKPQLSPLVREQLVSILAPDLEQLRKHTGREFSEWSL